MKRFIVTASSILLIFFTALYFISIPHEWEPQTFRLAMLGIYLGFSFALALYHVFLYFFSLKERAYLLFAAAAMLMAFRVAAVPGSVLKLVTPEYALPLLYYIANLSLLLPYIFAHWFTHDILRIKWGGLPTRLTYIVCLGLPIIAVAVTGRIEAWYMPVCSVTNIIIVCKGFANKDHRKDPYIVMYLCMVACYCLTPFLPFIMPSSRDWFAPVASLWLPWMLLQVVLLSRSYGEAKYRERELQIANDAMLAANTAMKELVSNISHDLKTPLAVMSLNLETLSGLATTQSDAEYQRHVRTAYQKNRDLQRLIGNLFEVSRIETGRTLYSPEWVSLLHLLAKVREKHDDFLENKGISLDINVEDDIEISTDPQKVWSVFDNIIYNAARHTESGGSITITVQNTETSATVTVTDTGCGIAAEHMPRIFERFYKGSQARGSGGDSGMGLYIVKSVMEGCGGGAEAESEPGKGTSIILTFPARLATKETRI